MIAIAPLASAVLSRIWPYILAAAIGAGAAWYVQGLRLDAVRADLRAAKDRIAILDASNRQCAADVKAARAAVDAIKAEAEERRRAAAAAVHAAETAAVAAERRAADLAGQEPATADQCAAVDALTRDYLRGRQ